MTKGDRTTTMHRTLRALLALAVFGLVLGLADLGIGLGTEANPDPFGRPEDQMAELIEKGSEPFNAVSLLALPPPVESVAVPCGHGRP